MYYYTTLTIPDNIPIPNRSSSLNFMAFAKPKDLRAFQAVSSSLKQLPQSLEEDIGAPDADASTASSRALAVEDVFPINAEVFFRVLYDLFQVFLVTSWEVNMQNGSIKRSYPLVN